jgi:aminodeoxyfutalosine deaminase
MIGCSVPSNRDYDVVTCPKIELHVHLEGTVQPETLLAIANANGLALPGNTVEELRELYRFRDFAHFIEVWLLTTTVLRTADDFRRVVTDYAAEAQRHGAVYLEGIFAPAQNARRGVDWDVVFEGYCDGVQEARELHGVEVRLTPDVTRGATPEEAEATVRHSIARMDRGVVGLGLGGLEAQFPPELYTDAFRLAREAGLGSVPHAGEAAGVPSIRGALDALEPDRIRHGIRAVEDPALVRELAELASPRERLVAHGRELYAWHPEGVARSKLWSKLASRDLGVAATARNWATVTKLLEIASD